MSGGAAQYSHTGVRQPGHMDCSHRGLRGIILTLAAAHHLQLAFAAAAAAATTSTTAASTNRGQQTAAKYVANWTKLPSGIASGRLSNAPLLGNGDLGISVGGSLPGSQPPPPPAPPGGNYEVTAAPCNASDPRQLWAGKLFTSPGIVSSITNNGAPVGQCLSTYDLRPVTMRTCGDGDTMWTYNASTQLLRAAATSSHPRYCMNADSQSTATKPNQPGWIEMTSDCGPKCERYVWQPVPGQRGDGLLKPICPVAVPKWQCPGLKQECLTVKSSNTAESSSAVPPPAAAGSGSSGAIDLHVGLNQMWGLREYNRCMLGDHSAANKPGCVSFHSDTTFPRRLGFGGLSISPTNPAALAGGTFSAEMHMDTAEVRATLTSKTGTAWLAVHVVLAPDENVVLTTITAEPPIQLRVSSWVLPLDSSMKQPCRPTDDPSVPGCLDGHIGAGVRDAGGGGGGGTNIIWSQRQPLSRNSSSKPIDMAMASIVLGDDFTSACGDSSIEPQSTVAAACVVTPGATRPMQVQIATALQSNWDLCNSSATHSHHEEEAASCDIDIDPLDAAVARAATAAPAAIEAANQAWWASFWQNTSVELPADPVLERFYYAHSYLIASASRPGKIAAGLWGPWVHDDSPAWAGDFTLDYNHEANHWGLYSNNRLAQAQPQYAPILDFIPKARAQAAFYNCSARGGAGATCANGTCTGSPCPGLHFPGHIAPFGFDATLAGEPWASMADHSNGVYAALNMIQEWEYGRDQSFLRGVAFPFCRDVLLFYQAWMLRRADGSWVNQHDQANECNSDGTVWGLYNSCWQNNTVFSNGFARRVASALPAMAKQLSEPVDPHWAEISLKLDPLPTVLTKGSSTCPFDPPRRVIVLAGNYSHKRTAEKCPNVNCGTLTCAGCQAQVAGDGMMDVMAWPVFPGEAVSLASAEGLQQAMRDTLQLSAEWGQGNSFCSVFSQAARVRMPLELWLPEWRAVIQRGAMTNGVVYQGGGGLEVAGALQAVADLMLQSVTLPGTLDETFMALFPLNASFSDMSFHRLRGKGAFVVSARWDAATARLDGAVTIESEVGGPCSLQLPPSQWSDTLTVTSRGSGRAVPTTQADGRWGFASVAGETYLVLTHPAPKD